MEIEENKKVDLQYYTYNNTSWRNKCTYIPMLFCGRTLECGMFFLHFRNAFYFNARRIHIRYNNGIYCIG